jgi:hypothetical protein
MKHTARFFSFGRLQKIVSTYSATWPFYRDVVFISSDTSSSSVMVVAFLRKTDLPLVKPYFQIQELCALTPMVKYNKYENWI